MRFAVYQEVKINYINQKGSNERDQGRNKPAN